MSRPDVAGEPSMEEILVSVRKIIAEEPGAPRAHQSPSPALGGSGSVGRGREAGFGNAAGGGEQRNSVIDGLAAVVGEQGGSGASVTSGVGRPLGQSVARPVADELDDLFEPEPVVPAGGGPRPGLGERIGSELGAAVDPPRGMAPIAATPGGRKPPIGLPPLGGERTRAAVPGAQSGVGGLGSVSVPAGFAPAADFGAPSLERQPDSSLVGKPVEEGPVVLAAMPAAEQRSAGPVVLAAMPTSAGNLGAGDAVGMVARPGALDLGAVAGHEADAEGAVATALDALLAGLAAAGRSSMPEAPTSEASPSTDGVAPPVPASTDVAGGSRDTVAAVTVADVATKPVAETAAAVIAAASSAVETVVSHSLAGHGEVPKALDAAALLSEALAAATPVVAAQAGLEASAQGASEAQPAGDIEEAVAELLRPMLRQWLADNMPRILEKALRKELAMARLGKVDGGESGEGAA